MRTRDFLNPSAPSATADNGAVCGTYQRGRQLNFSRNRTWKHEGGGTRCIRFCREQVVCTSCFWSEHPRNRRTFQAFRPMKVVTRGGHDSKSWHVRRSPNNSSFELRALGIEPFLSDPWIHTEAVAVSYYVCVLELHCCSTTALRSCPLVWFLKLSTCFPLHWWERHSLEFARTPSLYELLGHVVHAMRPICLPACPPACRTLSRMDARPYTGLPRGGTRRWWNTWWAPTDSFVQHSSMYPCM